MDKLIIFISQHWALVAMFVIVLGVIIWYEFNNSDTGNRGELLTPLEGVIKMNHENALVIDLREFDIYAKGHIIGAVNVEAKDLQDNKKLNKYKNKPLILVANTDHQSLQSVRQLHQQGYVNAYSLQGGINAWRQASLPLVKE